MSSSGEEDEEAGAVPGLNPQPLHPVGGNPPVFFVPSHPFVMGNQLTQEQYNLAPKITSQGDSKSVYIPGLGDVTRTTLRNDLLTNRFQDIFRLQHPNLLRNLRCWHSNEADLDLQRYMAIISERVSLAFEYAHRNRTVTAYRRRVWAADLARTVMFLHSRNIVHGCIELSRIFLDAADTLKLHLIPYQLIPRQRNANYTADEVRDGRIPTMLSDVYSTAAVEYFILTEQEPPLDKSRLHFTSVSPEADRILVLAGSVIPIHRPSAKDMSDALKRPYVV